MFTVVLGSLMSDSTETQKLERLVHKIAPHSRLVRAWPLQGGISAQMTAFEIARLDGQSQKMILRRPGESATQHNPRSARNEYMLLQILRGQGLAVPEPYFFDSSGEVFSTPCIVIEYIEGSPDFAPSNRAAAARQMAEQLARIHSADFSRFDLSFLPKPPAGFEENFHKRPAQGNETLAEDKIRKTLEAALPIPQHNLPALLHGDYWPGNLLWRNERLAAVIDWEDARIGDPLIDFAISRLDILWIYGLDALNAFSEHYLSNLPIDTTNLPYWDLCAALRLIRLAGANLSEWAAFFHPYGRDDITEQTIREHYLFFITQAFEKLALR